MRTVVNRTALISTSAVALCFAAAAPAAAAPEPVTLALTPGATSLELEFTLNDTSYLGVFCAYDIYPTVGDDLRAVDGGAEPVSADSPTTIVVEPLDPAMYAVRWACYSDDGVTFFQFAGSPEDAPRLVTVGAAVEPPLGTGSAGSSQGGPAGLERLLAGLFGG